MFNENANCKKQLPALITARGIIEAYVKREQKAAKVEKIKICEKTNGAKPLLTIASLSDAFSKSLL